tara:strand:+ start:20 stop:544 length:525 start_codon:yes stop_codon:yes gene_type:complete
MNNDLFSESWPFRCPVKFVAEAIKDIVSNKVVCDVGCGGGDFLKSVEPYCKKAIGVDIDGKRLESAKKQGLEVYLQSIYSNPPEADVYFIWTNDLKEDYAASKFLLKSAKKKITILVNRRKENEWSLGKFGDVDKKTLNLISEVRYVPYQESHSAVPNWPISGDWAIGIIKNYE